MDLERGEDYQPYLKELIPKFLFGQIQEEERSAPLGRLAPKSAEFIFQNLGKVELPIDVESIARLFRVGIIKEHDIGMQGELYELPGNNGLYYVISLLKYMPPQEKRATIAHEIGHIILGDELGIALPRPEMETLCDIFAASLLAPEDLIRAEMEDLRNPERESLATFDGLLEKTQIPPYWLARRLIDLKILPGTMVIIPLARNRNWREGVNGWIHYRGREQLVNSYFEDHCIDRFRQEFFSNRESLWKKGSSKILHKETHGIFRLSDDSPWTWVFKMEIQTALCGYDNNADFGLIYLKKGEEIGLGSSALIPGMSNMNDRVWNNHFDITGLGFREEFNDFLATFKK